MIQLVGVMWMMAVFFAIIGFLRGFTKEVISTSGIILALFALFQFDQYIRAPFQIADVPNGQIFLLQVVMFAIVVFLAYQTRALGIGDSGDDNRDDLQASVLGGIFGFLNGYLIWGSVWYFLDINQYPFSPYIIAPSPGSPSDTALNILPLVVLAGGPGGSGDILALAVIVLFLIVLFLI
ncbi:MAG: CvpA family protein [Chloroflexota bacterium]